MREVLDVVARVASSRLPVILLGETGTGKEVVARLIHEQSPRKSRRIVRVNCGAIPKDLVESTLFGHERGAFTGAHQLQKGVFEEADKGTVFLDEVGELPASAQAALLRVLETGAFARVGSTREMEVDVRIVAATHRNLDAMVQGGQFREDLYYRLSGAVIEIPSLAERAEDIAAFARRFVRLANETNGRNIQGITPEAMQHLQTYAWPGNVRELRNTIERAVVVARGPMIGPDDLPARVRGEALLGRAANSVPGVEFDAAKSTVSMPAAPSAGETAPVRDKVQGYEAQILRTTLESVGWNRAEAAKQMGIPVRTLSYRMKVLGVKKPGT
jgi:DNA-binding NtrC family response regulator